MQDKVQIADVCEASVTRGASHKEATSISGYYTVECFNNGQLKWKDDIHNLVTTVGKNFTMDTTLGNTAGGAVVMGLKGTGTAVVADTTATTPEVKQNDTNDYKKMNAEKLAADKASK